MTHFVSQPYQPGDTIAAVATPPGEGGVAIIRVSGQQAVSIAAKVFSGPVPTFTSHTAHYGYILDPSGRTIDDGLLLPMLGRRSYTGEDTVEIHCHGGRLITRRILESILAAGARAALPGEFTFRAFMNGKLDLTQAEAVQELIGAKNERALDAAEKHLQGHLSRAVAGLQTELTSIAAILEAWVDFPEEGLEFASLDDILTQLRTVCRKMQQLLDTYHDGRILHDGLSLCLSGTPNVGKSSLMNALLEKERAIVSHIPGTTRDVVEDFLSLNGLNIRITDTAGIRDSEEVIEREGIRRSRLAMTEADLVLLVLDATREISEQERQLLQLVPDRKAIIVWNKCDIAPKVPTVLPLRHVVQVSAKTRMGIDSLKSTIDAVVWDHGPPSQDELLITSARHHESLGHAVEACQRLIRGLEAQVSPEFLSIDMRSCLFELGKIIGVDVTEEILSAIFSTFCVGK